MALFSKPKTLPTAETALPGRAARMPVPATHHALGTPLEGPWPEEHEVAYFALGCFWGAERLFWQLPGVYTTAVGYQGGFTPNPTYEEVCSGQTGHAEVVMVVFDPAVIPFETLLARFWDEHDPTQGMRQGNDIGTQYRSALYLTTPAQQDAAEASKAAFEPALRAAGYGPITTEVALAPAFYYAEPYHQQYLSKIPDGYCGLRGTGVACPMPTGVRASA
ncbi:MAG: peptide-methionine (S)-S-oxide reductase MsrA [Pseudomonadales bacterium]|nr:peptide-methionine (S)-S-oxide reductase MsrA [Pseudomonadales bacterium]